MAESADRQEREERVGAASIIVRWLAAFLILAIPSSGFIIAEQGDGYDSFLALALVFISFSGIGLFYLICTCLGVCRLASSEARYSGVVKMLNQMSQAVVITDQEGSVRYMNERYRQLTGGKKRRIEVLFSLDAKASRAIAKLKKSLRQGTSDYDEIALARPLNSTGEGETIYAIHVNKAEAAGEAIHIWQVEDISQRRQRQERQFVDLTQAINHLDHAAAGFVAWDKLGNITYLNATLANWIGVDLAAATPEFLTLPRLIGAQCAIELQQFLSGALPSNSTTTVLQLDLFHDSGKRLPALFHLSRVVEEDGMGRAVIILHSFLQAASPNQNAMRLDEDSLRFAHYFNQCPIALAVIDGEGYLQTHNPHFAHLFALEEETLQTQGLKISDLMAPDDSANMRQMLDLAKEAGQAAPIDTRILFHNSDQDETRYIRLFTRPLAREQDRLIIGVVETSEQKVLEHHVGTLEQHMEQGQKMQAVGQLAGGIAHDFNNVLTAIIMSCDLLLSNHRSSDPSHPDIMNIKNNAGRAAALVRQLLAFSRRQTLRPELFDVSDMLSDVRLLITRLVGINITFKIEHGRDLWPIKADRSELERAIINLATNARDAMSESGGTLTIRSANISTGDLPLPLAQQLEPGDYVLIEVRDNGTGMPEAVREKIFEPFFTTKEVGQGTGLGLSMVYGIVTQTGGHIHCESQPGKGTIFSLYLPAHKPVQGEESAPPTLDKITEPMNLRDLSGSATVLVVEDEDGVRMGSVKALQSRGYRVLEAASGIEALDIIKTEQENIDLIVSDVVMPEMDGPSLLGEVQALGLGIKFIFVSGYAEEAFAKNLPENAQFAFLPKPFSLKQLALKVKEILEKSQEEML